MDIPWGQQLVLLLRSRVTIPAEAERNAVVTGRAVRLTPDLPPCDTSSSAGEANEEIHTVNTSGRVILNTKIDVLANSESEVTGLAEVSLQKFVFLYFQSTFQNFQSFLSTDGYMDGNLFVTTDSERTKGVTGFGVDRLLSGKLFEHTSSTCKTISTFSNAAVEDKFVYFNVPHGVLLFVGHGATWIRDDKQDGEVFP